MAAGRTWLGSMAHVRTKTLEAWPEKEGAKILTATHP